MTSLYERSVLIFGNSSISNSLCDQLAENFAIHYLPYFPILTGISSKPFINEIASRSWLRRCNIISSTLSLNKLLADPKLLAIFSSCSSKSISNFSDYLLVRSRLKIYHLTSSPKSLDRLLETLNMNVIPCYPNIVTEFKQNTIKIVGKYIVDIPAESISQSSQDLIELFNRYSSSVILNIREMEDLFKARFILTSFTYAELLRKLSPMPHQRNYFTELEGHWQEYEPFIKRFSEFNSWGLETIKQNSTYLSLLDPSLSDIAWIIRTLVFDKSYKMERFIDTIKKGI